MGRDCSEREPRRSTTTSAKPSSSETEAVARRLFTELKPGDRIEAVHNVTVGSDRWTTATQGTVVRTERRRHGLHFRRNPDDKVFSDIIVLKRDD